MPKAWRLPAPLSHSHASSPRARCICFGIPVLPGEPGAGIDGQCTPAQWGRRARITFLQNFPALEANTAKAAPCFFRWEDQGSEDDRTWLNHKNVNSPQICAFYTVGGEAWALLTMLPLPTQCGSPKLLTRPGPQAVPGRVRRGWATSLPRSRCTQLQFRWVPLASSISQCRSRAEPSRGWAIPPWHWSCPQMASLE